MNKIIFAVALLILGTMPAHAFTPATGATKVCMVGDSIVARGKYWRSFMADTRGAEWSYKNTGQRAILSNIPLT